MPPTIEAPTPAAETKPRYTTVEQLDSYRVLMDDTQKWQRKESKDKTFHRVAHMIPQFTGATGEDFVGHPDHPNDPEKTAQHCFWRCSVERFDEKSKTDPKTRATTTEHIPLGSFLMDADKFMKEFVRV